MDNPRLIFLISLPRSGSTLLQRILTAHPDIHSVSEPWLLLPFGFLEKPWGLITPYDHEWARHALKDFIGTLPGGREQFHSAIKDFVLNLYRDSLYDRQAIYFLDKTPRYYLILPFLKKLFPDAKYIFLFRNPLAVFASILTTWLNNELRIYRYYPDLYQGPIALAEGYSSLRENSIAVQYNDLVSTPEAEVKHICDYLNIDYDSAMLSEYLNVELRGQYGDQAGHDKYSSISTDSMHKWKNVFNSRYRKRMIKNYIRRLSDNVLAHFNTSVNQLDLEIDAIPNNSSGIILDAYCHFVSYAKRWLFLDYFKQRSIGSGERYKYYH